MKSWKTTLAGILGALGAVLSLTPDPKAHAVGVLVAAAGTALMGASARDNGVTSEQAGAK